MGYRIKQTARKSTGGRISCHPRAKLRSITEQMTTDVLTLMKESEHDIHTSLNNARMENNTMKAMVQESELELKNCKEIFNQARNSLLNDDDREYKRNFHLNEKFKQMEETVKRLTEE